ncbi:transcriptional regulator EutR [Planctomycetes bacterium CA13]|uniref:Transcriptional regulator EutR n=2 Tax=Novipirellula herctigrandis TaxID=2527986 RepID=A0A5C5Z3W6_9BACT|nr:transcriptional regulator EutR [Planctomycetes bacterium CA13]
MQSAVKDVRVIDAPRSGFSAQITLFQLGRTALFSLNLPSTSVHVPAGREFVSVNIAHRGSAEIASPVPRRQLASGAALVLDQDQDFNFKTDEDLETVTLCFYEPFLQEYARKFNGPDSGVGARNEIGSNLDSEAGACFYRYLNFIWDELQRGGVFRNSRVATEEIEDSLWALLLLATQPGSADVDRRHSGGYATYAVPAEEYILGHLEDSISVADIAAHVGISVPTLNRAFQKCHAMGPKAFVKRRRLEKARADLLNADSQQTTVTSIASRYGFWHLSQFGMDYKRAFHESPSVTLRR